jgi:hypothetical protein
VSFITFPTNWKRIQAIPSVCEPRSSLLGRLKNKALENQMLKRMYLAVSEALTRVVCATVMLVSSQGTNEPKIVSYRDNS